MRNIIILAILLVLTACGHSHSSGGGDAVNEADIEGDFNFGARTCQDPTQNTTSAQYTGGSYFTLSFRTNQLKYSNYNATNGCLYTNSYEFSLGSNPATMSIVFLSCGYSNSCAPEIQASCDQANNANYGGRASPTITYRVGYANGIFSASDGNCSTTYSKIVVTPPSIL